MIQTHQRLNGPYRIIQRIPIPQLLISDAGYIQILQMLIPFLDSQLPTILNKFNFKHNSIQMCVERNFGVLKGQWHILGCTMIKFDVRMVSHSCMLVLYCITSY